jgi:hypothetical protein
MALSPLYTFIAEKTSDFQTAIIEFASKVAPHALPSEKEKSLLIAILCKRFTISSKELFNLGNQQGCKRRLMRCQSL